MGREGGHQWSWLINSCSILHRCVWPSTFLFHFTKLLQTDKKLVYRTRYGNVLQFILSINIGHVSGNIILVIIAGKGLRGSSVYIYFCFIHVNIHILVMSDLGQIPGYCGSTFYCTNFIPLFLINLLVIIATYYSLSYITLLPICIFSGTL